MKNQVPITLPKPGIAKWGNFNHTTLVRAELFRGNRHDNVAVKTIEGMVRSSHDLNPLAGISVKLVGAAIEALTDENGWFLIVIEKPSLTDVLVFTSVDYKPMHLSVAQDDFLHVNLKAAELVHVQPACKRWTLRSFLSF